MSEVEVKSNALARVAQDKNVALEIAKSMSIIDAFLPYYEAALRGVPNYEAALRGVPKAAAIVVTSANYSDGMRLASDTCKAFKNIRIAAEKVHKKEKDFYLRVGKCIDGARNAISDVCETEEKRLQDMEDFAERAQAKRKAKLKAAREAALLPFIGVQTSFYDLESMPDAAFAELLEGSKLAHEARIAAAAKAKAESGKRSGWRGRCPHPRREREDAEGSGTGGGARGKHGESTNRKRSGCGKGEGRCRGQSYRRQNGGGTQDD